MPNWVQLEFTPEGEKTGAMQINLDLISRVHIKRVDKKLDQVVFKHGEEPAFQVDAFVGAQFLEVWTKYCEENGGFKHISPEAEPGKILIANGKKGSNILTAL